MESGYIYRPCQDLISGSSYRFIDPDPPADGQDDMMFNITKVHIEILIAD